MTYHRVCGAYPFAAPEFYRFCTSLSGVRVVHADTCSHVFMFLVPCCDVRYDFRVNRCSIHVSWIPLSFWEFTFYLCQLYLFTYSGVYDFYIRWCSCRLTVAQWGPHVEQKMLTLAKHMISLQLLVGFVFLCSFLYNVL
jgi:hypothetical protein